MKLLLPCLPRNIVRADKKRILGLLILTTVITTLIYIQFVSPTRFTQNYFTSQITFVYPSTFIVNTRMCQIPDIDPFDKSIRQFIGSSEKITCGNFPKSITFQDGNILKINRTIARERFGHRFTNCKYQGIRRKIGTENDFEYVDELQFVNEAKISEEFIRVDCYYKEKVLYTNFHAFVLPQQSALNALESRLNDRLKSSSYSEHLNVLMVGIDSVSRLNHMRTMPKTREYMLNNLSAFELQGYTKVADNTFVNIVPMTTGKFLEELPWDESKSNEPLDKYNFIWKNFTSQGYSTFYAEDYPAISIFNYLKRGFDKPPAMHYIRPLTLAMAKESSVRHKEDLCVGDRLETDIVLNYLDDFLQVYKKRPNFSFTFLTALTHGKGLSAAATADDPLVTWLQSVKKSNLLNNTILFLFSDHGMRYGDIRTTFIGKLEERLPMMYVVVPKWFLEKYPHVQHNLRINSNRLTTPFDIYATLEHILQFNGTLADKTGLNQRAISLFKEIPENRTCDDAGILIHWCVCMAQTTLSPKDSLYQESAAFLKNIINNETSSFKNKCAILKLEKINSVHLSKNNEKVLRFVKSENDVINREVSYADAVSTVSFLQVDAIFTPGFGRFEATVKYDEASKTFSMAGDISRLNKYGHDGDCVQMARLRKFCFCGN